MAGIATKYYRGQGTYTGDAINKTVGKILMGNFDKGLNKVIVVLTDGRSNDQVLAASNYARSQNITLLAVGIGSGVNVSQLLEIAQTPSNIIMVTSYDNLR